MIYIVHHITDSTRIRRYGGPQSQLVDLKFARDWHDYLACGLGYIVVVVDGRGTGFKGRKLRNPVKGNLGYWETVDQLAAARLVILFLLFPRRLSLPCDRHKHSVTLVDGPVLDL